MFNQSFLYIYYWNNMAFRPALCKQYHIWIKKYKSTLYNIDLLVMCVMGAIYTCVIHMLCAVGSTRQCLFVSVLEMGPSRAKANYSQLRLLHQTAHSKCLCFHLNLGRVSHTPYRLCCGVNLRLFQRKGRPTCDAKLDQIIYVPVFRSSLVFMISIVVEDTSNTLVVLHNRLDYQRINSKNLASEGHFEVGWTITQCGQLHINRTTKTTSSYIDIKT